MALLRFSFVFLALTLSSCGGGGGGDENGESDGGGNENPDNQNINSGLTGRIYTSQEDEGWAVDLETGNVSQLPNKRWWDTGDYENSLDGPYFTPHPNNDGSEILLLTEYCLEEYEGERDDYDCAIIIDSEGERISQLGVFPHGVIDGRLSKDGNYFALTYANEDYVNPHARLLIYDKSLNLIGNYSELQADGDNRSSFSRGLDWSRNGQITYAYKKSIYITSPYSTEGVAILTLPDSNESDVWPAPATLKFSPDGTKIAFRYVTDANQSMVFATIWVMNSDGTDLHQLAHDPSGYQLFNDFSWSPDGRYILVQEGGTRSHAGIGGTSNRLSAIPSDSRNVPLDLECVGTDGIICVRTYFESPDSLTRNFDPWSSTFEWIE